MVRLCDQNGRSPRGGVHALLWLALLLLPPACSATPDPALDDAASTDITDAGALPADDTSADASADAGPAQDTTPVAPKLVIVPPTLDFGALPPGGQTTRSFKLFNQGGAPLTIHGVAVSVFSTIKTLTVSHPGPFVLAAGESQLVDVDLVASGALLSDGSPAASLSVTSDDPSLKQVNIPVFAKIWAGSLQVDPAAMLDFGLVGKGYSAERKVQLLNKGGASVEVTSVTLTDDNDGEFALVPGAFPPVSATPTTHVMKPGALQSFRVKFTALGTVGAQAKGKLRIKSDDPDSPDRTIHLVAERAAGVTCEVQLIPEKLDFGVVTNGKSVALTLTAKNVGSGVCSFVESKVLDCPTAGVPPQQGAPTCSLIGTAPFLAFAPVAKLFHLEPGASGQLQVLFTGPADGGLFIDPTDLQEFFGFVALRFKDQTTGLTTWIPTDPAKNTAKLLPNLVASVGKSSASVTPDHLDFGLVQVGCKSEPQQVKLHNTGSVTVAITRLELIGCGGEVAKVGWPTVPAQGVAVVPQSAVALAMRYAPKDQSKDTCQLVVTTGLEGQCVDAMGAPTSSGPCKVTADCSGSKDVLCKGQAFATPLHGQGTLDLERTEVFTGGIGKKVDLLLVVDNSPGMAGAQAKLNAGLPQLMQIAAQWHGDYHIGVVTTDMASAGAKGKLRSLGQTRVVTPKTADPTGTLLSLAQVGDKGAFPEQGLAAARAALTLPHAYDSAKACLQNSDCKDGTCVAGPDGQKACGGHNRGFLRKDAGLEIVFVSDAQDASPGGLAYYLYALLSVKGITNKGLLHVHAIGGTVSNAGCSAIVGNRYAALANDTGGVVGSICDASFAATLKTIGEQVFAGIHSFRLAMPPQPATITVSVDGKGCAKGPKGWFYEGKDNRVVLVSKALGGACEPKKGVKVVIQYKALCLP